jgi:hypothetical protein
MQHPAMPVVFLEIQDEDAGAFVADRLGKIRTRAPRNKIASLAEISAESTERRFIPHGQQCPMLFRFGHKICCHNFSRKELPLAEIYTEKESEPEKPAPAHGMNQQHPISSPPQDFLAAAPGACADSS